MVDTLGKTLKKNTIIIHYYNVFYSQMEHFLHNFLISLAVFIKHLSTNI